jgi:hypothetical protein
MRRMVATFVVRVVIDRLSKGQFVGEAEHVASGRTTTIRDAGELERFVLETHDAEAEQRP